MLRNVIVGYLSSSRKYDDRRSLSRCALLVVKLETLIVTSIEESAGLSGSMCPEVATSVCGQSPETTTSAWLVRRLPAMYVRREDVALPRGTRARAGPEHPHCEARVYHVHAGGAATVCCCGHIGLRVFQYKLNHRPQFRGYPFRPRICPHQAPGTVLTNMNAV